MEPERSTDEKFDRATHESAGRGDLALRLLGGFELSVEQAPKRLAMPCRQVVAFLALRDRPVPRALVSGTLWPDGSDHRAAASLRSTLWQLRSIHPGLVRADRTTLALSDGVDIDARRLLRASLGVAGRNGLDVAEPFDVDLFRYDLLPGWYDEWLGQEQERMRQVRLTTLELLTMQLLDAGEYLPAVHTATLAVEGDPLRESAQRALIEVYIRTGNYVDAVRQYERYAAELRSDFGLCPSPMLETLIARLPVNVARFRR